MKTVKELIESKQNNEFICVSPYDSVAYVIQKMSDFDLGAIIVMDNNDIVGVFSEKDYARKLLLKGKSSLDTQVHEVMVTDVVYVTPDYKLEECLALMSHKHIRHLPVIDNGKVIALISMESITFALLEGKEFEIASLLQYITGSLTPDWKTARPVRVRELIWHRPFGRHLSTGTRY